MRPRWHSCDGGIWHDERGQASVEYALLLFACMAILAALAALWRAGRDGRLQGQTSAAASHALVAERAIASAKDLLLY